ncbi:hypothetical protein Daura_21370 [Dactylosporangium aurantiacum]|uniref:Uncharacterized protein n=1 Tax=Dactylosporangium aurantiacum TaxID=35754 RepID=A0A9Q9ISC7_9ACTN|nr:hypothetical protein [Dactylosporangium aurantiacum]MDG6108311.1 hypothetical protein [Dactylosporangium aurantiacum]UWZ58500.1 hypothetical protein Daura_21370 [Dactylosporangium aurantiacum]
MRAAGENLSFASAWVALGGFAVAAGRAVLGWWGITAGLLLVAARAVWTIPWWVPGYGLFWIWAVTACVNPLRRRPVFAPEPQGDFR